MTRKATERWAEDAESLEGLGRRADAVYDKYVKPKVSPDDEGKFVAVDVDTGKYAIDADELAAEDRLLELVPSASVWLTRVGSRYAVKFGWRGTYGNVKGAATS